MVEVEHSPIVHQHSLLAVAARQMRLGISPVVYFDEEEADMRLGCRRCYTVAVEEEEEVVEGSRLDRTARAAAAEAGMIAEMEESRARSGEVGKIALGYDVNRVSNHVFAMTSSTRWRICKVIRRSCH